MDFVALRAINRLLVVSVAVLCFTSAFSNGLEAGSPWPKFEGGANNAGVAAGGGATGSKKWKFTTGGSTTGAAIGADETVYVGSADGSLYAINGVTGVEKWAASASGDVASTPALGADGTIYLTTAGGYFDAISASGALKWQFRYTESDSNPAIGPDGTLYLGSGTGNLYALDPRDGSEKWAFKTGSSIEASPAVESNGVIYFSSEDGNIYAVNPNGTLDWSVPVKEQTNGSPSIGPDGTVYVGTYLGGLYALDGADGAQKWFFPCGTAEAAPAIGKNGLIYVGDAGGAFFALNAQTGAQVWSFTVSGGWDVINSAAIGADGTVYINVAYTLYALDGATGDQEWTFAPGFYVNATPAIGWDGTMYVSGADGNLYALGGNISNFYTSPAEFTGGTGSRGVLQVADAAPAGGITFALSSSGSAAQIPGSVSIPANARGVSFAISTDAPISAPAPITITATSASLTARTEIVLEPYDLSTFYMAANSVIGGHSTRGVVQLLGPSGPGGNVVSLTSSSTAVTLPSQVTVPAGVKGVSFAVQTSTVSVSTAVQLTVVFNGSAISTNLTVNPYPLNDYYCSPSTLKGGGTTRGVVQITGPAGPEGDIVSLSSPSTDATVPSTVTIPAGKTGVSFAITTKAVVANTQITLSANYAGDTKTAVLNLTP